MPAAAWATIPPVNAAGLFVSLRAPWWIAGGWAIDLFLGRATRTHADLDVGLLRRDVAELQRMLVSWEVFEAQGSVLNPLLLAHSPRSDVNSLWCRPTSTSPWSLEVMLDDSDGEDWVFRREQRIRRPLVEVVRWTPDGLPFLAPEVQLLYKAKRPREKDHRDFERTLPSLESKARQWLANALGRTDPGHQWIRELSRPS